MPPIVQPPVTHHAAHHLLVARVVAVFSDEGIPGTKSRDHRPGLDASMRGVAREVFDLVAAWVVDWLGRSLPDLVGLLGELSMQAESRLEHVVTSSVCCASIRDRA